MKPNERAKSDCCPPQAQVGHWVADDGARIYFEDSGGEGQVIFYIYGLGCTIQHWKYARQFFGHPERVAEFRQVWIDYRGQGQSERSAEGLRLSLRRIADDILGVCRFLKVPQATFMGQSLGGLIALRVAECSPEMVAGLVLLGTPVGNPVSHLPAQILTRSAWAALVEVNQLSNRPLRLIHGLVKKGLETKLSRKGDPLKILFRELVRHSGFSPNLSRTEDIEDYIEGITTVPFDLFFDLALDMEQFDVLKVAKSIAAPALVIGGALDRFVPPEESLQLAEALPNGQAFIIEHGSHCPHFDDPQLINRKLLAFLTQKR